jgi:hypothetical protein
MVERMALSSAHSIAEKKTMLIFAKRAASVALLILDERRMEP